LFSELLLEGRKKQFIEANQMNSEVVFLDRGIPDILAYMHYIGDSYPSFLIKLARKRVNIKSLYSSTLGRNL
jgi:predicted ATPase